MNIDEHATIRRIVMRVAALNLAYFGVEFAVARHIGSVSLFADSVDFLEVASVNLLPLIICECSCVDKNPYSNCYFNAQRWAGVIHSGTYRWNSGRLNCAEPVLFPQSSYTG